MSIEQTARKLNAQNARSSFIFARVDSKDISTFDTRGGQRMQRIEGFFVDKECAAIPFSAIGKESAMGALYAKIKVGEVYKISQCGIKNVASVQWTPSTIPKELVVDKAKMTTDGIPGCVAKAIPSRRWGSLTCAQVLQRMEKARVSRTMADMVVLVVQIGEDAVLPGKKDGRETEYIKKDVTVTDGDSIFALSLWGEEVTGHPGNVLATGQIVTILGITVERDESHLGKLKFHSGRKRRAEFLIDEENSPAVDMLEEKSEALLQPETQSQLKTQTVSFAPKGRRAANETCAIVTAQELADILHEKPCAPSEDTKYYELRNTTLSGFGSQDASNIAYLGCNKCLKKGCDLRCTPGAAKVWRAFTGSAEISDWSGTAGHLLLGGDDFLACTQTEEPEHAQAIAEDGLDGLLYKTRAHVRVAVSTEEYNSELRQKGKVVLAQEADFDEASAICVPSARDLNQETSVSVVPTALNDLSVDNSQMEVAGQPATFVALHIIASQKSTLKKTEGAYEVRNFVKATEAFDKNGSPESAKHLQLAVTCELCNLVNFNLQEGDHAIAIIDGILDDVGNVISIMRIKGESEPTRATKVRNFGQETMNVKIALLRDFDAEKEEVYVADKFLASPSLKKPKVAH